MIFAFYSPRKEFKTGCDTIPDSRYGERSVVTPYFRRLFAIVASLAILPGLTHYTIFSAPSLAATVIPFLDEPTPTAK